MLNEYQYILASNKIPKLNCPYCKGKKHWQRYFDKETREALPEHFGRCDNIVKCGQWNDPYKLEYAKVIREERFSNHLDIPKSWKLNLKKKKSQPIVEPVFIPDEIFKQTLEPHRYEQNTFLQNLMSKVKFPFDVKDIERIISLYYLGTVINGYRAGANTFPYIDIKHNIRAIQVKQFDETNHTISTDKLDKVILNELKKKNKPLPKWLDKYIEFGEENGYFSCLFGEHLLSKYPLNPVALVEAPKTAIYSTLYFGFPEIPKNLIWLAVYNKNSFSFDKLKVLQGRKIFTFPDLSKDGQTFKEWQNKAKEIENRLIGTKFIFSDLLEQLASDIDRSKGKDIADYLITNDWRLFRINNISEQSTSKPIEICEKCEKCEAPKKTFFTYVEPLSKIEVFEFKQKQLENWDNDILELETYFSSIKLPTHPIRMNEYSNILNVSSFIESHLMTVKANNGKRAFLPYLERLQELRKILMT